MCLVLEYGEYKKSYERESKKCHLEVLSSFTFRIGRRRVGRIAADFYTWLLKNRFLQHVYLLRIVTQLVEILACLLPCSGVRDKWPLSRSFYAGPAKWRENNGVKMTSWSRKKFPRASKRNKTSQNHTSLLQELDCCLFEPKRRFWSAFQFPGTRNKWMYFFIANKASELIDLNFDTRMRWSTLSNAFATSKKAACTRWPLPAALCRSS